MTINISINENSKKIHKKITLSGTDVTELLPVVVLFCSVFVSCLIITGFLVGGITGVFVSKSSSSSSITIASSFIILALLLLLLLLLLLVN